MQKILKTPSSTPPDPLAPRRMGPPALWLPLLLVLAAAVSLSIDTRVAFWSKNTHWSGMVRALLETSQSFGNGLGVLVIALAIFQLDPARRWALPRMLATALGSGLSADIFKTFVVRLRPRWFDFSNDVWLTFSASIPAGGDHSALESFPSAHTATAVGLVFVLIWLYPRGRWLFCAMAVLVAFHRIQSQAHFPSDILFGAALGSLGGLLCVRYGPLARTFDRLESRWRGNGPTDSLGRTNSILLGRMANETEGYTARG